MGLGTTALLDVDDTKQKSRQAVRLASSCMCMAAPGACSRSPDDLKSGKNWFSRARTDTKQVPPCLETKMRDDALGEEGSLNAPTAHLPYACTIM